MAFFTDFSRFIWYKREVEPGKTFGRLGNYLPEVFIRKNENKYHFRPIHFSLPASKITRITLADKTQYFSKQVIDEEVAAKLSEALYNPLRADQYVFDTEEGYYGDLQKSRFGITGKRAGWDCLRHYEMAANGVVMCFKDLHLKPDTCAPHGLNSTNCIPYRNYNDLVGKLEGLTDQQYEHLLEGSYQWIATQTTEYLAKKLIIDFKNELVG
jgi:hypothetical protein